MEGYWEFLTHSLLIVGASLHGERSDWSDNRRHYYHQYSNPWTCKTTQVFVRSQELLRGHKVCLYYRVRDDLTGEVEQFGEYGTNEIVYILPDAKK